MRRKLLVLGMMLLATSAFAMDPFVPGEYTELFVIPKTCPCGYKARPGITWVHGLQYMVRNTKDKCLRYEDIWARREDGTPIPVTIEENGSPGDADYSLDAYVDEDGAIIFHVRVIDVCPKVG